MKSIFVFSSLLFISIAAIFQGPGVVIKSELPNYSPPGATVDLVIKIKKDGLSGFSKLQMVFPEGFSIESEDAQGGTFSFIDQKLKVIWVSLPATPEFVVKFKVKIKSSTKGSFPLEGKFSYIQEGARQDANFSTNIFVAKDKPSGLASAPDVSTTATEEPSTTATANEIKNKAEFKFSRTLSSTTIEPSGTVNVKLNIVKKGISGFGKVTEIIPAGFKAEEIESNGAIFSVLNNEVRFLWMTLPATDSFEISYKLTADAKAGEKSIKGSFSYVEDTKTRLNSTSATVFKVKKQEVLATVQPKKEEEPKEPTTTDDASQVQNEATAEENPKEEITAVKTTETAEKPAVEVEKEAPEPTVESTPAEETETVSASSEANEEPVTQTASGEVSYRVQICATRKAVDKQYFVKYNNVTEDIYADMHEGWHKFTVGAFNVYGEARNHREEVKETNKIKGPFVTAYNSGNRITVQEALMISKQQWVP